MISTSILEKIRITFVAVFRPHFRTISRTSADNIVNVNIQSKDDMVNKIKIIHAICTIKKTLEKD